MNRQELLYDYQREAVDKLSNGKILLGAVGSGKSRTALAYYFEKNGGIFRRDGFKKMVNPRNLLIITTPKKRDDGDWVREMLSFRLHPDPKLNYYKNDILIDSWNNIKKYINLSGWDILFDEQHLNGYGAWAKAFLKIAKKNDWIVLTATPGDNYEQYLTIWLANGYFRNASEFYSNHCIMNPYIKFRKIMRYTGTKRLERLKENVLVRMNYTPRNTQHHADIFVDYDVKLYKDAVRRRWDVYKDQPMQSATEMCYVLRKIVNTSEDRIQKLVELTEEHPKSIIFYNFDYERDIIGVSRIAALVRTRAARKEAAHARRGGCLDRVDAVGNLADRGCGGEKGTPEPRCDRAGVSGIYFTERCCARDQRSQGGYQSALGRRRFLDAGKNQSEQQSADRTAAKAQRTHPCGARP